MSISRSMQPRSPMSATGFDFDVVSDVPPRQPRPAPESEDSKLKSPDQLHAPPSEAAE
jgi:hypothetical protein